MKRLTVMTLAAMFMLPAGCSPGILGSLQTEDPRSGSREILNYEYANRALTDGVRAAHYLINIEIEGPYIIRTGSPSFRKIDSDARICGSALVRISTEGTGRVTGYTFVKRAGLGLDRYVEAMMKEISVDPLRRKGESESSEFIARFVFAEGEAR